MINNKSKIFFYSISNIFPRFIFFICISLFSFFLSKEEVGSYDLLINTVSLFVPVLSLQLGDALYRWVYNNNNFNIFDTLKTILIFNLFSHIGLYFLLKFTLNYEGFNFQTLSLYIVLSSSLVTLLQYTVRALGDLKIYSVSCIIQSIGVLLLTLIYFFLLKKELIGVLYAYLLSNLLTIVFITSCLPLQKLYKGQYKFTLLLDLLKFSIPLIPATICWWLINIANRYIITFKLETSDNGMYAVATMLPSLIVIFNSIFLLLLQDLVFSDNINKKEDSYYTELFRKLFTIQIAFSIVLIAFVKLITRVLFSDIYFDIYKITPLIVIGILMSNFSAFWGTFYLGDKKTFKILKMTLAGGLTNIIFTCFSIKYMGLFAPAIGSILGFSIRWIIAMNGMKKYRNIKVDFKVMAQLFTLLLTVSILIQIPNLLIEFALIVVSLVLFYFYNLVIIQKILRGGIFAKLK